MEKPEASGIAILLIGVALLVTTFFDAYLLLTEDVSIIPLPSLIAAFGEALAPLIEASIRMMYLGVMGWIGSTITMRGITVLLHVKLETKQKVPRKTVAKDERGNLEEAWEKAFQEGQTRNQVSQKRMTAGIIVH